MIGLEVPSLVIGVSGLAVVFDKACIIWRTIAEAQNYGEDVRSWLAQLEMEFYRFELWWTYIERLSTDPARQAKQPPAAPKFRADDLVSVMQAETGRQVENAVINIIKILEDVESILKGYGILTAMRESDAIKLTAVPESSTALNLPGTNSKALNETRKRQDYCEKTLLKRVPWFKRVKFSASAWKETGREVLRERLDRFGWWNRSLLELLPSQVRESILSQGPLGYLLDDVASAQEVAS